MMLLLGLSARNCATICARPATFQMSNLTSVPADSVGMTAPSISRPSIVEKYTPMRAPNSAEFDWYTGELSGAPRPFSSLKI